MHLYRNPRYFRQPLQQTITKTINFSVFFVCWIFFLVLDVRAFLFIQININELQLLRFDEI